MDEAKFDDPAWAALAAGFDRQAAARWLRHGPRLCRLLQALYGAQPGFGAWLREFVRELAVLAAGRSEELREADAARLLQPPWYLEADVIGYSAYVDRFGATLSGVGRRIPYLQDLGVRLLHLLPFLRAREGEDDGGFALASFEEIAPALGSQADLEQLAAQLRAARISLAADFVLNHVADDHPWARAARDGDAMHRDFFHVLRERQDVLEAERTLDEALPGSAPGNFTRVPALRGWVWTTFHPYEWDLNYANPQVFARVACALLHLANRGVEIFRLDSAAYLWKRVGTPCRNLPEVHLVLQALRAAADIAAPGVLLLAEASVPASQIGAYLDAEVPPHRECQLAYRSTVMAGAWAALARQDAALLADAIAAAPTAADDIGWLTYVRCQDEILWSALLPEDEALAAPVRAQLQAAAAFLQGEVAGSWGRGRASFGVPGIARLPGTNGMAAALVGLSNANGDTQFAEALRRLLLLYGLALCFGGVPVVYMGDELGQGNDVAPRGRRGGARDERWLQRPALDEVRLARRKDPASAAGKVHAALGSWLALRRELPVLHARVARQVLRAPDPAILGLQRGADFVAAFNFSSRTGALPLPPGAWLDLRTQRDCRNAAGLGPWEMRWLARLHAAESAASR